MSERWEWHFILPLYRAPPQKKRHYVLNYGFNEPLHPYQIVILNGILQGSTMASSSKTGQTFYVPLCNVPFAAVHI